MKVLVTILSACLLLAVTSATADRSTDMYWLRKEILSERASAIEYRKNKGKIARNAELRIIYKIKSQAAAALREAALNPSVSAAQHPNVRDAARVSLAEIESENRQTLAETKPEAFITYIRHRAVRNLSNT